MAQKKRSARSKKPAASASKNKRKKQGNDYFIYHLIITALSALFLGIFLYTNSDAIVNTFVKKTLTGLFGVVAYLIPLSLMAKAVYLFCTKNIKRFWIKFTLSTLAIVNLSAIVHLMTADNLNSVGTIGFIDAVVTSMGNGGIVGAFVSVLLVKLVQKIAAYIILTMTLLVLLGAISGISTLKTFAASLKDLGVWAKDTWIDFKERIDYEDYDEEYEYIEDKPEKEIPQPETVTESRKKKKQTKKIATDPNMDAANSFAAEAENGNNSTLSGLDDLDNGIDAIFSRGNDAYDDSENQPILDLPIGDDVPETISGNIAIDIPAEIPGTANAVQTPVEAENSESDKPREKNMTKAEKSQFNEEFDAAFEQEVIPYVYPPLELLKNAPAASHDQRSEMRATAEKLISVLDSFGVKARLLQVTQGPTVTRYEIQPDTGTKLSKIEGLSKDIALNLAVSTVLVAPVPGKAAVGIEIPNKKVSTVGLQELLASREFKSSKSKLAFVLGKDIGGNVVVGDIAKMPHMLIAGATGSGKSVCINTIIMSILYNASPQDVKLIMVDPKRVELGVYNGIPHLLVPVVTDPKKAAGALNWAVTEMMRRYDLFNETNTRKIESYNKLMRSEGREEIPQLVIIIDELADLMMVAAKEVESYICRIAQLARAAGIHLIIATQRPSVDVITGLIKANIPSRIALAVSSQVDSRTILDHVGAEKLLGRGDMLFHPAGARDASRVQGAFVDDSEIENVLNFIKEHSGLVTSYSEDLEEQIERCATGENGVTPDVEEDGDALLPDAINLAMELGKISTSMIQRRLGVGYSRAGRIVDQMEKRGIISGPNGSKPRDVLVSGASIGADYDEDESDE